jgi:hypothetical protein
VVVTTGQDRRGTGGLVEIAAAPRISTVVSPSLHRHAQTA